MEFEHEVESAVVTGARGGVAPWVIDRLADAGVDVVGIDFERPAGTRSNVEFRSIDLTEQGPTWECILDVDPDAVIHLAAISSPLDTPGTEVFMNNILSTYNVFEAAGRSGAQLIWTSSQAAYGPLFAETPWIFDYLPVDEAHECRPEDAYGVSKVCGEALADMTTRKHDISVTSIRPATIYDPTEYKTRPTHEGFDLAESSLSGNFWAYVDVRDLASMVDAALASPPAGHEVYLCAAEDNTLGQPTVELLEAAGVDLPAQCDLDGVESVFSTAKAHEELEWKPTHSWRETEPEGVTMPTWQ